MELVKDREGIHTLITLTSPNYRVMTASDFVIEHEGGFICILRDNVAKALAINDCASVVGNSDGYQDIKGPK